MNAWHLASSHPQLEWTWPITLERYDQNPSLTDEERETLAAFVDRDQQGRPKRWSAQTRAKLGRLWLPLQDIFEALEGQKAVDWTVSHVLINEMHHRQRSFWGWSEQEWVETLGCSVVDFMQQHGCVSSESINFAFPTHIIFRDWPGKALEASLRQFSVEWP